MLNKYSFMMYTVTNPYTKCLFFFIKRVSNTCKVYTYTGAEWVWSSPTGLESSLAGLGSSLAGLGSSLAGLGSSLAGLGSNLAGLASWPLVALASLTHFGFGFLEEQGAGLNPFKQ